MSVSIAIINHNYSEFLRAAIDSALAQVTPASEVIVVDDGSTDNSRDIIAGYGDRIVPVLKPGGGHVSAVNAAYAVTRGELCIFLDADDLLYPNCLAAILESWGEGDVKLQYRLDTIDRIGVNQEMPFPHFAPDLGPEEVRRQSCRYGVYPWTVSSGNAFSRRLLDRLLPIDPIEIPHSPDGYINKMAPLFGEVKSITNILGAYRVHGRNKWAQGGGGFRISTISRNVNFDVILHRKFLEIAARQGVRVEPMAGPRSINQMEYRLVAYRFARREYPFPDDRLLPLTASAIKAAGEAPNINTIGRIAWSAWFATLAFFPRPAVRQLFGAARAQTGRTAISRLLVRASRGSARALRSDAVAPRLGPRNGDSRRGGPRQMRIAIVVATLGRPQEVGQLLEGIRRQSFPCSTVVLSAEGEADLPSSLPDGVQVIFGPRGTVPQRNRAIDLVQADADVIAFFDDDYLPSDYALEGMATLFHEHPEVVGATGLVLADGVRTGGIDYDSALGMVADFDQRRPAPPTIEHDQRVLYGCNMAVRASALGEARFDENLRLYGWQEDIDLAARLLPFGRVVRTNAFAGVHRGVSRGRTAGVKFGFSQIVNPFYLVRKGTMQPSHAASLVSRNFLANHLKALWPEAKIDRAGRARGNWIGIRHLLSGKLDPAHVIHVEPSKSHQRAPDRTIIINGKFFAAPATGVQRVGRELLNALDAILSNSPPESVPRFVIARPSNAPPPPAFERLGSVSVGRLTWQFWEQASLPRFAKSARLVNLCNLAPLVRPGVVMIHDAQVFLSPESYSKIFAAYYRFVLPRIARRAEHVLTVSEFSRSMLVQCGVAAADKITVIHNGADHILRSPADCGLLTRFGLEPGRYVVALANAQKHKNVAILLEAFNDERLDGTRLVLVGSAGPKAFAAKGRPCPANVVFAGKVTDGELRGLLEAAACLAFPSTTEGFGLPPLEAMSVGCPTVVAPCGALPEVCGDAAIYVQPHDPRAWAATMAALAGNPELRRSVGEAGRTRASAFTWERSARRLLDLMGATTR